MSEYWTKLLAQLNNPWQIVGIVGQLLFFCRFAVQWIASERAKRSVIPVAFWYISMIASVISLTYGIAEVQVPIILGNVFSMVVYLRNMSFIYGWGKKEPASA